MEAKMTSKDQILMNTPFGKINPDSDGAPIGLARIDPDKSYSGVGGLLQDFINNSITTCVNAPKLP